MIKLGIKQTQSDTIAELLKEKKIKYSIYVRYAECLQINVWIRY